MSLSEIASALANLPPTSWPAFVLIALILGKFFVPRKRDDHDPTREIVNAIREIDRRLTRIEARMDILWREKE